MVSRRNFLKLSGGSVASKFVPLGLIGKILPEVSSTIGTISLDNAFHAYAELGLFSKQSDMIQSQIPSLTKLCLTKKTFSHYLGLHSFCFDDVLSRNLDGDLVMGRNLLNEMIDSEDLLRKKLIETLNALPEGAKNPIPDLISKYSSCPKEKKLLRRDLNQMIKFPHTLPKSHKEKYIESLKNLEEYAFGEFEKVRKKRQEFKSTFSLGDMASMSNQLRGPVPQNYQTPNYDRSSGCESYPIS